jgi:two-component system, NarL family, invasion response regulator UvrY
MTHRSSAKLAFLVAEDHPSTRLGIKRILLDEFPGSMVGEAGDAATTLSLLESRPWTLLVLDISLPDRHGLEVLADARARFPTLSVLIYSAHPADQFAVHAFRAGADGYLTKERAPEELCRAVRTIIAGGSYVQPSLDAAGLAAAEIADPRPHQSLSPREFQVLRLTACGLTGKAISGQLGLSQKTVSTYRCRVFRKLRVTSVAALVRYAVEHGLIER